MMNRTLSVLLVAVGAAAGVVLVFVLGLGVDAAAPLTCHSTPRPGPAGLVCRSPNPSQAVLWVGGLAGGLLGTAIGFGLTLLRRRKVEKTSINNSRSTTARHPSPAADNDHRSC